MYALTSLAAIILTLVAFTFSEHCYTDGDCDHVTCDDVTHLACSHYECTCIYGGNTCNERNCTARAQCETATCDCGTNSKWHCYDLRCRCGASPIGK